MLTLFTITKRLAKHSVLEARVPIQIAGRVHQPHQTGVSPQIQRRLSSPGSEYNEEEDEEEGEDGLKITSKEAVSITSSKNKIAHAVACS